MNREQFAIDQLNTFLHEQLGAAWNVISDFDIGKYESYPKPYVALLDPSQTREIGTDYENSDSWDYQMSHTMIAYIGFSATKGKFDITARETSAVIERTLRGVLIDKYTDEYETAVFKPIEVDAKMGVQANEQFSNGLNAIQFSYKVRVSAK